MDALENSPAKINKPTKNFPSRETMKFVSLSLSNQQALLNPPFFLRTSHISSFSLQRGAHFMLIYVLISESSSKSLVPQHFQRFWRVLRIPPNLKNSILGIDHLQQRGVLGEEWKKMPGWMESNRWHKQEVWQFPFCHNSPKVWAPPVNSKQGSRGEDFLGASGTKGNRLSWRLSERWHLISCSNGKLQILTCWDTSEDTTIPGELWLHLPPKGKRRTNVTEGCNS